VSFAHCYNGRLVKILDDSGELSDEKTQAALKNIDNELVNNLSKLKN
jgi:hypothetical protein